MHRQELPAPRRGVNEREHRAFMVGDFREAGVILGGRVVGDIPAADDAGCVAGNEGLGVEGGPGDGLGESILVRLRVKRMHGRELTEIGASC